MHLQVKSRIFGDLFRKGNILGRSFPDDLWAISDIRSRRKNRFRTKSENGFAQLVYSCDSSNLGDCIECWNAIQASAKFDGVSYIMQRADRERGVFLLEVKFHAYTCEMRTKRCTNRFFAW